MDIKIALAGNPNSGKTTLFNALTGSSQYVGNWPGVTVEKKEGRLKGHKGVVIQDLPGIYSLSPYTLEEVVARGYLVGERPDAILNIVDGTNIERNLYLTTQLIELGIPVVVAVNMIDLTRKSGDEINLKKLGEALGCRVVEMSALKGEGSMAAAEAAVSLALEQGQRHLPPVFTGSVEHAIAHIEESIGDRVEERHLRWYAIKVFERDEKVLAELALDADLRSHLEEHITQCEAELDDDAESIIINQRYAYISGVVDKAVRKKAAAHSLSTSDKIDRVVTNRVLALPIFAVVMFLVYYVAIGTVGDWVTGWTNDVLFGEVIPPAVEGWLTSIGMAGWLVSLIVDGIIGGVGAVLGFVPQMLVLFLMLSILEDIGYMARVAFIMDRIFRKFGLSGKSFIPMLIGSGCGVPGVMASRTIENERDRRMTIMTTCFVPCGAKMPIIGLFAGALFGGSGLVAVSAYFIGVAAIIVSGIILKKTKAFAGDPAPFVMELPQYHVPAVSNVLRATWERGWSFIKRAGTVILASSIVLWFLQGFGYTDGVFGMVEDNNSSLLAAIGGAVSFLFTPLGFGNWQSTVAAVTGLIAKENVVSTFGVILAGLEEAAEDTPELLGAISVLFTQLSAYSFMVFNLLCAPCFAAMGAIRREMNNPKWTWAAIGYMCGFAYVVSLMVYQFGGLITGEVSFGAGTVAAAICLVGIIYLLARKNKYDEPHLTISAVAAAAAVK
ncbi:MAG: ferrous iron transport protein B [Clostridiales bacterium]|nr:ferrous iron transport protein B [Clostridiales bacterium]